MESKVLMLPSSTPAPSNVLYSKTCFYKNGEYNLTNGRSGGFLTGDRKQDSMRVKDRM